MKQFLIKSLIMLVVGVLIVAGGMFLSFQIHEWKESKKWEFNESRYAKELYKNIDEFSRLFVAMSLGRYYSNKYSDRGLLIMKSRHGFTTNMEYVEGVTNYCMFISAKQSNYVPTSALDLMEIEYILPYFLKNTNEKGYVNFNRKYVTNMLLEVRNTIQMITNEYKEHFKSNWAVYFDVGKEK